jgi:hypothetical protein
LCIIERKIIKKQRGFSFGQWKSRPSLLSKAFFYMIHSLFDRLIDL